VIGPARAAAEDEPIIRVSPAASDIGARALSCAAAVVICWAFFLPWMDGSGPFDLRSFSGFDFARLVRNFEITTDSQSSLGQVRASAIALYLVPALAVNAAALHACEDLLRLPRSYAAWGLAASAGYAGALLVLILVFSLVPLNDLASAVGAPRAGFGLTAAGACSLALVARRQRRRMRAAP
jgi:hypothetical protein